MAFTIPGSLIEFMVYMTNLIMEVMEQALKSVHYTWSRLIIAVLDLLYHLKLFHFVVIAIKTFPTIVP